MTTKVDTIRRDLYAVKTYMGDGNWCVEYIFRSREAAKRYKRGFDADLRREYPLMEARIVHPNQRTVDLYCLAGNKIAD